MDEIKVYEEKDIEVLEKIDLEITILKMTIMKSIILV